jgi:glutathione S-transferase
MAIKLHRCRVLWSKWGGHPCWKVQKALDDAGIEYELVKEPALRRNRTEYEQRSGTRILPAIEFEDGTILREDSKDLVERISSGRLAPPA